MTPTIYVVGLCFSSDRRSVVLILKTRPQWQAGRLNGVGGKVELTEHPQTAMAREFLEEAGVETDSKEWNHFATISGVDWQKDPSGQTEAIIFCYELANDLYFTNAKTSEEEKITKINVNYIPTNWVGLIPNLHILIPLACSTEYERPINLTWSNETKERRREETRWHD
jgi:8-oxo-dGTP diphosphatase